MTLELDAQLDISKLDGHKNIAELLSDKDCDSIAKQVLYDYNLDLESRGDWERRNASALKLALQVVEEKTEPWANCANVKFPMVTIAALQCHAREYPALITGTEIVKCRVIGSDQDGTKTARARRVAAHMSYQVLEEDSNWEDQMDRVMFTKPIVGTAFKKVYFDPIMGHNVAEMILAQDLVIPYKAKSLKKASRITHVIPLTKNDLYEREIKGYFLSCESPSTGAADTRGTSPLQQVSDEVQGVHAVLGDSDTPTQMLEQHRFLDLDGDGYAEPYIVTVEEGTQKLRRIVARFFKDSIKKKDGKILHIEPEHFFVKYGMIPSPDGGIYDLGFGALLGPLNESVNTIINQLLDAGSLSILGGGFLGRGAKLRRGQNQFKPGEWKQVDGSGQDLKASIVPLPTKEPSQVLFALLGMLVNYGERISGSTDIMSGENVGQNTPASTAQELVKQGSVIFNGIFKRTYRSLREEFQLWYRLNQLFVDQDRSFEELSTGKNVMILSGDYQGGDSEIRPAADPNVASVEKRMQQAIFLKQAAATGPGYKQVEVERRLLEAAQIPYLAEVWDANIQPAPNQKLVLEQAKLEFEQVKLKADIQYKMLELMQKAEKTRAEIAELTARAAKEQAEARGVDVGHIIAMTNTEIAAQKAKHDGLVESIKIIHEIMQSTGKPQGEGNGAVQSPVQSVGATPMAAQPSVEGGTTIPSMAGGAA